MKKLLIATLATVSMVACSMDETVETMSPAAISFADSFVEGTTRVAGANPSTTNDNLNEFFVWSVIDNETGIVFDDERVFKSSDDWTYVQTQYWTPGHNYYFSALAGDRTNDQIVIDLAAANDKGMSVDGLGEITFTNVDGTNDVLYAEYECTTPAAINTAPAAVKFGFDHLLSKVKFTFTNGFLNDNFTIVIKNVKMTAPKTGKVVLEEQDNYAWEVVGGTTVLDMGNMAQGAKLASGKSASSDNERLTIPASGNVEYTVTFDVELWNGGVLASGSSKTVKISGCAFEPGKAYNFKADINHQNVEDNPLFAIVFEAEVEDWVETPIVNNELIMAAAFGGDVTLTQDVVLTNPLRVSEEARMTLDLNGHTITADLKQEGRHHYAIDNYGTLTLKGEGAINARGVENFGTMTIDGDITITNIDTNGGSAIWNEGNLVINGGTFTTNANAGEGSYGGALSTQQGATCVINGGTFVANSQLTYAICNYGETVINDATVSGKHGAVASNTGCNTVINGGTFSLMENPNVSDHCVYYVSEIKGGTFTLGANTDSGAQVFYNSTIAAGLKAVEKDGVYYITSADVDKIVVVSTVEELNKLNAKNACVILGADIDFQGAAMTKPIELWGNSTFDGKGHKISNVKTAVQGGYATSLFRGDANPGNKVVKNLVIDGLSTPAGNSFASAIWSDLQGANIEIDNVTINNATIEAAGTVGGFVGFVSGSTTSVIIKNSSINNSNLNGGEADHKRGAIVGRAYGCVVTCENVVVDNVKINGVAATTSTLVGDKGYTGNVTVK